MNIFHSNIQALTENNQRAGRG